MEIVDSSSGSVVWSVLSGAAVPVHPSPAPTLPAPGPRLVHVSRVALTFPISTHLGRIIGYLALALHVGGIVYSFGFSQNIRRKL